jgi:ParB/RepB/Spo0J family partition protein
MRLEIVPVEKINFGDRYRKELGNIEELAKDIKDNGLITPIALHLKDNQYTLLAGGRRLTAAKSINMLEIPARIFDNELSEREIRIIELSENIYRKDLDWLERAKLEREIHRLQIEEHGEKISKSSDASGWTMNDTAEILGVKRPEVSASIKLANAADQFPQLFENCRTASDATKALKNLQTSALTEFIASKVESNIGVSSNLKTLADSYMIGDFLTRSADIPNECINLCEIDPPYAINLEKAKRDYAYGTSYNEIDKESYPKFIKDVLKNAYRVMTTHSTLIFWFAPEPWFEKIYQWITDAGFKTNRICGLWTKPTGQTKRPETYLANSYEMFFYARKGNPVLNTLGRSNIFNFPPVPSNQKSHPTERPVELMQELYKTFTYPGSRILIPFAGSGNGIIAANSVGMSAFGYDLSKEYRDSYLVKIHKLSTKPM